MGAGLNSGPFPVHILLSERVCSVSSRDSVPIMPSLPPVLVFRRDGMCGRNPFSIKLLSLRVLFFLKQQQKKEPIEMRNSLPGPGGRLLLS